MPLRVKVPFAHRGTVYTVGTIVPDDAPFVAGNRAYLEDVEVAAARVEQATAAPGEKRTVSKPRARKAT